MKFYLHIKNSDNIGFHVVTVILRMLYTELTRAYTSLIQVHLCLVITKNALKNSVADLQYQGLPQAIWNCLYFNTSFNEMFSKTTL